MGDSRDLGLSTTKAALERRAGKAGLGRIKSSALFGCCVYNRMELLANPAACQTLSLAVPQVPHTWLVLNAFLPFLTSPAQHHHPATHPPPARILWATPTIIPYSQLVPVTFPSELSILPTPHPQDLGCTISHLDHCSCSGSTSEKGLGE